MNTNDQPARRAPIIHDEHDIDALRANVAHLRAQRDTLLRELADAHNQIASLWPDHLEAALLAPREDVRMLEAMAKHLRRHPSLASVDASGHRWQITHPERDRDAAALMAWAESLDGPMLFVRNIGGEAFCYITGETETGHALTVWTVVTGFAEYVAFGDDCTNGYVSVDQLREFTNHAEGGDR